MFHYSKALRDDTTSYLLQKYGISCYLNAVKTDSNYNIKKSVGFNLAKDALTKAYEMDKNPVTLYFLAQASQKLGDDSLAINYFNQALLIIIPTFMSDLYLHLSDSYLSLKDYSNVVKSFNNAFFYNPENKSLLLNIGELYEKELKDKDMALKYYESFIKSNPDNIKLNADIEARIRVLAKRK
jgi:tetratricopeptide (TPR) repeat protein